jgi:hypothetical protein
METELQSVLWRGVNQDRQAIVTVTKELGTQREFEPRKSDFTE